MKHFLILILFFLISNYNSSAQNEQVIGKTFATMVFYMCVETSEPTEKPLGASIEMQLTFDKDSVHIAKKGYDHGEKVDQKMPSLKYEVDNGVLTIPGLKYDDEQLVENDQFVIEDGKLIGKRTGYYHGFLEFTDINQVIESVD